MISYSLSHFGTIPDRLPRSHLCQGAQDSFTKALLWQLGPDLALSISFSLLKITGAEGEDNDCSLSSFLPQACTNHDCIWGMGKSQERFGIWLP